MKAKKILVVEDERLVAEDIAECLRMTGYDVCGIANNGETALELAREHQPDLVLEDIVIQGHMDGIEVAIQMRAELGIPTVFLTAYSQEGILERAKEAVPLGFIIKPFDEESLLSTVKMSLHKSKMDERLKESEEWFSTTLNSIGDGVIATNREGEIQFMNGLAEEMTGWRGEDAEGERIDKVYQIFTEISYEEISNPALDAIAENQIKNLPIDCTLVSKSGGETPVSDSGAPIHDASGEIVGAVLVFRDISSQREADRKVKEYQSHLEEIVAVRTNALKKRVELEKLNIDFASRLMVTGWEEFYDELSDGLARISKFLDLDGTGVYQLSPNDADVVIPLAVHTADSEKQLSAMQVSRGVSKMPWFLDQLQQHGRVVLNSIDDLPEDAVFERETLSTAETSALVIFLLHEEKTAISFSSMHDREWTDDELIGLKSVATVVQNGLLRNQIESERRILQTQLNQSQKLEAIGKLTGGIAHDFNNMLVPIIGYADSILEEAGSIEWVEEISEIRKAATSAASLTGQLLAFSRKQILDKVPLNLNDEIEEMERMIQRMLGEDIDLILNLNAGRQTIEADQGQIQQVLVNLCVNARDAMPDGGSITITSENTGVEDTEIILSIADDGIGMSQEVQQKAFDPFFSTKGMDGTGLGLSVVMGIVHQHNGVMELESTEGEGTCFLIKLPTIETVASVNQELPVLKSSRNSDGEGVKILLVEDEPAVMTFVKLALSKRGFEVVSAPSRKLAIELFDEHEGAFDMVFTDAKLPDGTGIDVLNHIYDRNPDMKALISSGYTDDRALVDQAKKRGVQFLQKPYSLELLFKSLNQVLASSVKETAVVELSR